MDVDDNHRYSIDKISNRFGTTELRDGYEGYRQAQFPRVRKRKCLTHKDLLFSSRLVTAATSVPLTFDV